MKLARTPLSDDAIRAKAPSVFAERAMPGASSKYSFIPTARVVDALRGEGWVPVEAKEQAVKVDHRVGFQRHIVRFHRAGAEPIKAVGDVRMELSLVNSHDRLSGYQLYAGVYRAACANGMMVADSVVGKISERHTGLEVQSVVEASRLIAAQAPAVEASIAGLQAVRMTPAQQIVFAEAALILKYDGDSPVSAESILRPLRTADAGDDLWRVLNRCQEHLIRGGDRAYSDTGRRIRTRPVNSITEDVRLNKALWRIAEAFRAGAVDVVDAEVLS